MPDVKISELPAASSPLSDNDTVAGVQSGTTKQLKVSQLREGLAPVTASFVVLETDPSLTAERVLTPGTGLKATDGGAGAAYTMRVDDSVVATLSGSTYTGPITASPSGGITGSITQTTAGTPFITTPAGNCVTATTGSNGQVILSGSAVDPTKASVDAAFVTIGNDPTLTNERALAAGTGLLFTDGGAGGAATLAINNSVVATTSGSTFTGAVSLDSGGRNVSTIGSDVFFWASGSVGLPPGTTGAPNATRKVFATNDGVFSGSVQLLNQTAAAIPAAKPVGGIFLFSSASAFRVADGAGNVSQLTNVAKSLNANFTNTSVAPNPTVLTCSVNAGDTWLFEAQLLATIGNSAGFKYVLLTPTGSFVNGSLTSNTLSTTLATFTTAMSQSLVLANPQNGGSNYTSPTLHPGTTANLELTTIVATIGIGPNSGNVVLAAVPVTAGQTVTVLTGSVAWMTRTDRV